MILSTMHALRFLLSPRSLAGLLAANLVTLIPFVGGVMYVPFFDAGMDVGAGIIQPVSVGALMSLTIFGVIASLSGTLLVAVPVILYLHVKRKTGYSDYVSALLKWILGSCLFIAAGLSFYIVPILVVGGIKSLIWAILILAVMWTPSWMACLTYWYFAVREPGHNLKTSTKIMLVLAMFFWIFMSINFGTLIATD